MGYEQFIAIGRETLLSTALTVTPVLLAGLIIGLIVGIFQAATSINEATLAFVPKLIVVGLVLVIAGPFMISTLPDFFKRSFLKSDGSTDDRFGQCNLARYACCISALVDPHFSDDFGCPALLRIQRFYPHPHRDRGIIGDHVDAGD